MIWSISVIHAGDLPEGPRKRKRHEYGATRERAAFQEISGGTLCLSSVQGMSRFELKILTKRLGFLLDLLEFFKAAMFRKRVEEQMMERQRDVVFDQVA